MTEPIVLAFRTVRSSSGATVGVASAATFLALVSFTTPLATLPATATLVVLHELNNTENLGSILRIAAGFGANGVILGPRTADVFYRQAIRVSMGTVFSLGLAQSDDLVRDRRMRLVPPPQLEVGPRQPLGRLGALGLVERRR